MSDTNPEARSIGVFGRQINRRDLARLGIGGLTAGSLASMLAACADDDEDEPAAPDTDDGEEPEPDDEDVEDEDEEEDEDTDVPSEASGTLTLALNFDLQSLDPIATYTLNNGRWMSNVFSPLVWRDTELEEWRPPEAADSFGLSTDWEYVDDLTLEMSLREGVTFHNGEPFNAESVRGTFERLLDIENASPQRFNYTAIEEVEVIDEYSVRFIFNRVDPEMITKLAGYGSFITPPQFIEENGAEHFGTQEAPGTGPFRVLEYSRDDRLVMEASDNYWHDEHPRIQQVIYRIIPDDGTRVSEFLAGSIDVLTLTPAQADVVEGRPELQIHEVGVPTVSGLRLNAEMAPTDNLQVRQAVAHAIDLQTIIDTVLSGYATPVGIWQSPFSFGYEDYDPYEFDPDRAAQLLEEAGLDGPAELMYDVIGDDTQAREIASLVEDMLEAVGFEVEIRNRERATYFDDYRAGSLGNIVPFGWGGWTLDFDNTYYSMYRTDESYNPHYSNPEVDDLLEQQRATLDEDERMEIAQQLNQLIYDDYVDVALYQNTYLWGVNERVRDLPLPPDERLWLLPASVED